MFEFEKYLKYHKILILDGSKRLKKYSNITIDTIYRPLQKKWERDLRKVYEHTTFLDRSRWYGDWKYNVEEYETIIIINGIRGRDVIEFIQAKNPNARIIIYYETTIDRKDRKAPCYYEGLGCEFYSFDKYDCKIWGLKYNHYYYDYYDGDIDDLRRAQKHHNINYDLFFCGYDKKRLASLISLHENLKRLGIKDKFVIVATPHKRYHRSERKYLTIQRLPYEEIATALYESRCILDFVEKGQQGITLRPMEAIFYRKKLITNNEDIVNYDFYDKDNVFILGNRPVQEIPAFLNSSYKEVDMEIVNEYTVEKWLDRFF